MRPISTAALVFALSTSLMAQAPENTGQKEGRRGERPRPEQMDTDRDGRISSSEWKGPAEAFARLDSNSDGYVTREEMTQVRGPRGGRGPRAMDTNNDGKISRDEWTGPSEAFDRIDANRDGFITSDERLERGRRPR